MREERVTFGKVMSDAFSIYRNNFKLLFSFALLTGCFSVVTTLLSNVGARVNNGGLKVIISLFSFGITIISIYYLGRLAIGMYLSIANIYKKKDVCFSSMYDKGEPLFWTYFGVRLLAGLFFMIPMIIVGVGSVFVYTNMNVAYSEFQNGGSATLLIVGYIIIAVAIIGGIYLFYKMAMLTSIIILDTKEKNQIKESFKMTKGNARLILPLIISMIIPYLIILGFDYGLASLIGASLWTATATSVFSALCMALLQPLFTASFVVIFFNLSESNDFDEVEEIATSELVME